MKTNRIQNYMLWLVLAAAVAPLTGCRHAKAPTQNREFFTSGSKEADQRASQRMAKQEQFAGTGEGAGEKEKKPPALGGGGDQGGRSERKMSLFERLGGEAGVSNIVADFLPRAIADPRVNWERNGITQGGFSFHHTENTAWKDTPQNVQQLQKHLVQFFALATGGPAKYDGKDIKTTHAKMRISNAEFDAAIGDLKASLDKLQVPNKEQKELLSIAESTRSEIVQER